MSLLVLSKIASDFMEIHDVYLKLTLEVPHFFEVKNSGTPVNKG